MSSDDVRRRSQAWIWQQTVLPDPCPWHLYFWHHRSSFVMWRYCFSDGQIGIVRKLCMVWLNPAYLGRNLSVSSGLQYSIKALPETEELIVHIESPYYLWRQVFWILRSYDLYTLGFWVCVSKKLTVSLVLWLSVYWKTNINITIVDFGESIRGISSLKELT